MLSDDESAEAVGATPATRGGQKRRAMEFAGKAEASKAISLVCRGRGRGRTRSASSSCKKEIKEHKPKEAKEHKPKPMANDV